MYRVKQRNRAMEKSSFLHFSLFLFATLSIFSLVSFSPNTRKHLGLSQPISWLTTKTQTPLQKLKNQQTDIPHHPLDPLTIQEINKVRHIISSYEPFSTTFPTIHSLSLDEPDKSLVLGWKNGDPLPPRKAEVIAMLNWQTHVLTMDLGSGQVVTHVVNPKSGYPILAEEDMYKAVGLTLSNPDFIESINARKIPMLDANCFAESAGWYGPREEGALFIKVQCYLLNNDTPNFYMRPIEGLTVTINLNNMWVTEVIDTGRDIRIAKPTKTAYRYDAEEKGPNMRPIKPISIEQPEGPSFIVENGHIVKWANWEFHLKADQRAGLVISRAMVWDPESGVPRSVLYKGFGSELFVPYMDSDAAWYYKTYMDAGEYGMGNSAMSLVPLNDCPRNAYYMDGIFVGSDGNPFVRENMICLFERYTGDVGWRHSEAPIIGFKACI